jgi:transposase
MCRLHRDRIAGLDAAVADLDDRIAGRAGRWQRELDLLKSVPGFGDVVAQAWLAEIGPAPHRHFASHEKLACWVTLCPGNNISARKRKHGRTGDAGTYIKPMLAQAAWSAIRLNSLEPVGARSAGTCAGHAENQVEHAPDQHAETRPGDDVQWEVRAEVQAR